MPRVLKNGNIAHELTVEDQRKGQLAAAAARKARKTLKEELLALLSDGDTQKNMTLAMIQAAMGGDVSAFNSIRDTIGEKPVEKTEQQVINKIRVDVTND